MLLFTCNDDNDHVNKGQSGFKKMEGKGKVEHEDTRHKSNHNHSTSNPITKASSLSLFYYFHYHPLHYKIPENKMALVTKSCLSSPLFIISLHCHK